MEQFGKYNLRKRIAVGGMAEVFDAVLPSVEGFERRVAIKRILPEFSSDDSFVSMFVDEAKIAVQLSHSNIAQILELGCEDGAYFIAMEFVEGKDLRTVGKMLQTRGELMPTQVACYLVMQVAEALAFAHEANGRDGQPLQVTHRDLSPHNIMVTSDGAVKVIDFGLAKAMGRATHTRKGVLKGKLAYMSPEQSLGGEIDPRSDLFSLGACFYELLTGRRLFQRESQVATVTAVREAPVPPLRSVVPALPFELEAIVSRCLAKDPEGRYQSAQDLHDALQAFIYHSGSLIAARQVADWLAELLGEGEGSGSISAVSLSSRLSDGSQSGPATSRHMHVRRITEDPLVDSTRPADISTSEAPVVGSGFDRDLEFGETVEAMVGPPTDSIEIDIELDGFEEETPDASPPRVFGDRPGQLDPGAPPPMDTVEIRPADLERLVKHAAASGSEELAAALSENRPQLAAKAKAESKPEAPPWDAGSDTQQSFPTDDEETADRSGEDGRRPIKDLTKTDPLIRADGSEEKEDSSESGYRPPPPSRLAGGPRRGE